ncbi:flavin reductase family protein [Acidimangrovimonas pyrenivorans]|uniref:Flavin reductase family protein n=1 Tax=Acidimangrovimonas pyrenivorans TaxID=2030798 RepID=A0ABV7AK29_9RHOB
MFYRPADGHGLPHNPFNAIVTPRPIGWISTRGADGSENLAPYSFFNAVAYTPPQVMFATTGTKDDRPRGKDSLSNIEETEVFCVNVVGQEQLHEMNATSGSYGREIDEFALAGLERVECETIACSRVSHAPAALECRLNKIVPLLGESNFLVLGEVIGVHLRDDCVVDGRFDVTKFHPVSRLGYKDYAIVKSVFELNRPGQK